MNSKEIEEFRRGHSVGFCLKPKGISQMPVLTASRQFFAPSRVDCRDLTTPCEDQGTKPMCAAYAASNWAEAIMWKKNDFFDQIKPDWIYEYAKKHDGMPTQDGTTINAVLEALRGSIFDRDTTRVKIIRNNRLSVKYALHKYGLILGGFNVSDDWFTVGKTDESAMITGVDRKGEMTEHGLGGHCVTLCGYDKEGVWFQNSWSSNWMNWGIGKISWAEFDKQFMMGGVLVGCLNGMDIYS